MRIDLSFWRFVIILHFAKSLLWSKGGDTYIFHVGSFTNGKSTAVQIVILPISLIVGYVLKEKGE
tara:strand:- start:157 stop:351 length:195 start_codon:yes stop_codon:yes gene_type:complete